MAKRGMPKGARSLKDLLDDHEQWKLEVGRAFVQARAARGMTQSAFAEELEVSQPYVSQIESGQRTPSGETLRKLQDLTEGARRGDQGEE